MTGPQKDIDTTVPEPTVSLVRRRALTLVTAGVVAAALAGGGVWASSALADADRSAPTAYWVPDGAPLPNRPVPGLVPPNALSGKLLPLPSGFRPGPAFGADGNEVVVSGERAKEILKEASAGLSTTERKQRDDMLGQLKLKGLAGRTYAKDSGYLVGEIKLMQADPKALDSFSQVGRKMLELDGDGREAPKVDGHPEAKCAPTSSAAEDKGGQGGFDFLSCVAVQGDVLVDFTAYGPKSDFSATDAATLFKNQLDRLRSPGESV
ncbi:hypothetical protein ACGFY6_26870 [Streptomyces sp. NPDC048387]|uniref:hypothetical protein n=1 Tax=unclassified Streptomyces TaxID=2593676 RepID=UPI0033A24790